jgi:HPt (histidine-containing phosphotransfer) domain-containing protein
VALTANATVDDRAAGRRAGMDDFLAKPIQEADLDLVLAGGDHPAASEVPRPVSEDDDIRASVATIAGADFANQVRLADILLAFARRLPAVLAELDDAVVDGDHARVDRLAHGLKGSSGTLGAHRLAAACARLEAYAQKRDVAGQATTLRELHDRADVAGRAVTTVSQELVAPAA